MPDHVRILAGLGLTILSLTVVMAKWALNYRARADHGPIDRSRACRPKGRDRSKAYLLGRD